MSTRVEEHYSLSTRRLLPIVLLLIACIFLPKVATKGHSQGCSYDPQSQHPCPPGLFAVDAWR
uniref:Uncharacterized protein n=1 Tax=Leersia perrieri TaxID=77586 RepID=A0A0D9XUB6_9ORYZ